MEDEADIICKNLFWDKLPADCEDEEQLRSPFLLQQEIAKVIDSKEKNELAVQELEYTKPSFITGAIENLCKWTALAKGAKHGYFLVKVGWTSTYC